MEAKTPPSAPYVPLSDVQITEIAEQCGYDGAVPTVRLAFQGFKLDAFARAILASRDAELAKLRQGEPVAWEGTEGWEALAWRLCAEENGEEACNELVWEGGPIPEPWGDRWLKYEGEAKRMIALVGKHASPPPAQPTQAEPPAIGMRDDVYADSTPLLNVGNSAFEDWFQSQPFATTAGIKQIARDSYAAGMGDPLVTYAAPPPREPVQPLSDTVSVCKTDGLMFDAFGEPRTRYVRVSLGGNHCVMHPSEGDTYLKDARDNGDTSPYVLADVWLSEREFENLPEHDGF